MIPEALTEKNILPEVQAVEKEVELRRLMREMRSVLVAYSGGVDSTYLAYIAKQELGDNALCVMGISPSVSEFQRREAAEAAASGGFSFTTIETLELEDARYAANASDRCYFCKSELFARLGALAGERGVKNVVDGTNGDDISGHRPGHAAGRENRVRSPLAELSFSKDDIRKLSNAKGLVTWDRPASPCLASRIAPGIPVTIERLGLVERGESVLRSVGFREFRVRVHGDLARIEISQAELNKALDPELFASVSAGLKGLGFRFVTLDLEGFRSGSTNGSVRSETIS